MLAHFFSALGNGANDAATAAADLLIVIIAKSSLPSQRGPESPAGGYPDIFLTYIASALTSSQ